MAGPGGGPPRRSHTKSRKGCDTCKRRHIRCDESFPQCRNCTKHKIRCPYNDMPVPHGRSVTPDKPDLLWTNEVTEAIKEWRRTNIFPFRDLNISSFPSTTNYKDEELRLIYHVASICNQMEGMGANAFTLWTRHIPAIINLGSTHRYVMESLLAFSAMHIASLTDCPIVGNMAYEHRGRALAGLQKAVSTFSWETSDATLAASLVLSWQATDWRSWTQLMQGTSSVIDAMGPWSQNSQFYDLINETSTYPTAPPSPRPEHKPSQPRKEDLDAIALTQQHLQKFEAYLKQRKADTKQIQQLISFLKGSRKVSLTQSVGDQFERLRPLRTWLFYLPVKCLQEKGVTPTSLVTIAYYYTVALLMERLFPEIGAAYFGNLSIGSMEDIYRRLYSISVSNPHDADLHTLVTMMEFPMEMVADFRFRIGLGEPAQSPWFTQMHPAHFIPGDLLSQPTVTEAPHYPYGNNPTFSYSQESLPMVSTEPPSPAAAMSPLNLSVYTNQQYLSIPSPSYAGYSPTSSTFEGSVTYGESDEFGTYDTSGMPPNHMYCGSPNGLGVGFVSALQPVWN